jgi:regulator of PEP synthase PpsR (kinase-PPPase family)
MTAERVLRATLAQFPDVKVVLEVAAEVRRTEQIAAIVAQARRRRGLIAYTLVDAALRDALAARAHEAGVTTVDLLGPLVNALSGFHSTVPLGQPGLFDRADAEHSRRLDAVGFTVRHDDGLGLSDLPQADLVIVGPSRTSKTPLCAYLAHTRGLKVANVPLALGVEPPAILKQLDPARVVGLSMNAHDLASVRRQRLPEIGADIQYADTSFVQRELRYCHELYRRSPVWRVVDVTARSIEEVASAVCALTLDAPPGQPGSEAGARGKAVAR